jgi:hypothetical protein
VHTRTDQHPTVVDKIRHTTVTSTNHTGKLYSVSAELLI